MGIDRPAVAVALLVALYFGLVGLLVRGRRPRTVRIALLSAGVALIVAMLAAPAALAATYPEVASTTKRTSDFTVTGSSAGGASEVIAAPSVTVNGSELVHLEFYAPFANATASAELVFQIYDGATDLGRMALVDYSGAITLTQAFTPANGSHTYKVYAWRTGSNRTIACDPASGLGAYVNGCHLRITVDRAGGGAAWADITGKPSTFPPDLTGVHLGDLSDVNVTDPDDGSILTYDDPTGKWFDGAAGAGGGGVSCGAEDPCAVYIDPFSVSQVSLSEADRERADLGWVGTWGAVGLLLALLIALKWYGAWRFLRE